MRNSKFFVIGLLAMIIALVSGIYIGIEARGGHETREAENTENTPADAAISIAAALYREIVSQHDWGFPPEAEESVLERLGSLPPRDMRKRLLAAFGTAKLEGRNWLEARDFEQTRTGRSRKIGF